MPIPPHPHRDEAHRLLRAGVSRAEVARRTGASLRAVRAWARRLGVPSEGRGPGVGAEAIAGEVLHRLLAGDRPPQIASALGISAARVRQIRAANPLVTDGEEK